MGARPRISKTAQFVESCAFPALLVRAAGLACFLLGIFIFFIFLIFFFFNIFFNSLCVSEFAACAGCWRGLLPVGYLHFFDV